MIVIVPLGLLVYFGLIWLAMQAAKERYRGEVRWGLLAFFIGPFAFIPLVLAGVSKKGLARAQERERAARHGELERIRQDEEARLRARDSVESA